MFKKTVAALSLLSVAAFSAQALEMGASLGTEYLELNTKFAPEDNGLFFTGSWTKNYEGGSNVGGVGIGYQISRNRFDLYTGLKALYIAPGKGDNGFAAPIGAGVRIHLSENVYAYGEGYVAPRGLNNVVENYTEVDAGLALKAQDNLDVKVGYRYMGVNGKSSTPNHTLLDGAYIGAAYKF